MGNQSACINSQPPEKHTGTVILLHGLGDSGSGWHWLVEGYRRQNKFKNIKFVLPTAPQKTVTCFGGQQANAWYDIYKLYSDVTKPQDGAAEDESGILESKKMLQGLVAEEMKTGIPSERIVIAGFSQGGAMSIFAGLTEETNKFAGVVALSCYLLLHQKFRKLAPENNPNQKTPVFMAHGTDDRVVHFNLGKTSCEMLKDWGFNINWKTYEHLEHQVCPEELRDIENFLAKCFES